MKTYSLEQFAPSISEKLDAERIYKEIVELDPTNNVVVVDFSRMIAMTTMCAKMIFGKLYVNIGQEKFLQNIQFKNIEEAVQLVIKWGIQQAVDEIS